MKHLLIHAWMLYKVKGVYYIAYTHWIYLKEISAYTDVVTLLAIINETDRVPDGMPELARAFSRVRVIELPYSGSYVSAIKHFPAYVSAYKKTHDCSHCYVRYPVPFGWLCMYFFKSERRLFHFVGDPVDTVRSNPSAGWFRKNLLTVFFQPEHRLYMLACKRSKVFTNGTVLREKLRTWNIDATALISSTLTDADYFFDEEKKLMPGKLDILCIAYLRKAKGMYTLIEAFRLINRKYPYSTLTIAGSGEIEEHLKKKAEFLGIAHSCRFLGHIENREKINNLLRVHHLFIFTSVSEGSPRVVLEAMANGLPVISTPVGILPSVFNNDEDILFAAFNDPESILNCVDELIDHPQKYLRIRRNAFNKVKQFTLHAFINRIFGEA